MPDNEEYLLAATSRAPRNKGKLIGAKPPLRPKHIWAIRTRLMIERRSHDLAMFNPAIDSKLRGCDVVVLNLWHNYLLPIQRIRDGAINAVAAVPAALIQTK
jgi:hypothetical protein